MDKTGNAMLLLDFYQLNVKICQAGECGLMLFKIKVVGIENSLTTLGQKTRMSKRIQDYGILALIATKRLLEKEKRKLSYYSNIYVVSDPKHPENE